ncbi:class I mannose-6-phosphate isomerase [Aurantiacibacter spongiae]|uniref:Mannose-6-phosphate isomerase n=1 Tax=Aurantiacibacter spongiae TaxID=2488860 RepID=A0A3N5DLV4_9SPHN|nr:class I mannose-6-phosphate isomerase [Aurantiacibacter spongiae]RPF71795.1 mannose-6-phosphate isomerase [Aurantiacibacter spongiae]
MLLPVKTVEKVWGREDLPPPFEAPEGKRIGEIWFEPPDRLPQLLVKYLFTSDKLSVQCHPSDEQTLAQGLGQQGKEECWLVVDAEPGAVLGIGFDTTLDEDEMRAAAKDGSIEELLTWHEVQPGDFYYIPANTVHAIGAGCSIIEIQQNSDITYRLYDYGRPRELHLEEGMKVARGEPYDMGLHQMLPPSGDVTLVDGPHFRLDRVDGVADEGLLYAYAGPLLVIPLSGQVNVTGGDVVSPGQCALAPDLASVTFAPDGRCLIAAPPG